jgi:hypothetical protein
MALAKIEREKAATGQGCLGKAADDEPVFVLRAQDELAPLVVAAWASMAADVGHRPDKVTEAMKCADQMRLWQAANGIKKPD